MRRILFAAAVAALVAAGCGGDITKQLGSNDQLRQQVMDTIAGNRRLALLQADRIMASDSLRAVVVDHMLQNDEVAKQVIVRIATNPGAFDIVLEAAARDSVMREHLMTLVKGMQMASPRR